MRRFLCCTALLIVACDGSLSATDNAPDAKDGDANTAQSRAGSGGGGRSTGESGSSGSTTKPSRSLGQAGTTAGGGVNDTNSGGSGNGGSGGSNGSGGTGSGSGGSGSNGSGGSTQSDPTTFPDPVKDPDGFTALTKSDDTHVIYVSSSGDDSNDGLSEDKPVKTPSIGLRKLRDGFPDWVLFKRGDVFTGGLGNWRKVNGRSESEPIVVSAYGDGARPQFNTGGETALDSINSSDGGPRHDHIWFIGLSFTANNRDPNGPDFGGGGGGEGIHWRTGTSDLLFEDCVLRFYTLAASFQDSDNVGMGGIRLRRNQFLDSYSSGGAHSEGIYVLGSTGMLFEENTFDHNGWNEDVAGADPSVFNHNLYVDNGNTNIVLKNNIFLRASSHGAQLRPGGIADGNLFMYNAIGLLVGGGDAPEPGGVEGEAKDNVILYGGDIGSMVKEYGIALENINTLDVSNNIVANAKSAQANAALTMSVSGVTYADNIVYNWPLGKSTNGSYSDPMRDLASYDTTLGGPGTLDHFIEGLRSQSQQSWRTEYMAQALNAYFREGFAP